MSLSALMEVLLRISALFLLDRAWWWRAVCGHITLSGSV